MTQSVTTKIRIVQTIVVEGKDDISAVRKAVDANMICTHGYGISKDTLRLLESAYKATGLILFTDPDHAGRSIREKLTSLFPDSLQAYLAAKQARKKDDVGIENARPEDILSALLVSGATVIPAYAPLKTPSSINDATGNSNTPHPSLLNNTPNNSNGSVSSLSDEVLGPVSIEEPDGNLLDVLGLTGKSDSAALREAVGAALGIGYANGKTFLKRLRYMHISPERLIRVTESLRVPAASDNPDSSVSSPNTDN